MDRVVAWLKHKWVSTIYHWLTLVEQPLASPMSAKNGYIGSFEQIKWCSHNFEVVLSENYRLWNVAAGDEIPYRLEL